jgi:hypothetical protein
MSEVADAIKEMKRRGHTVPSSTMLLSRSDPEKGEIDAVVEGLEVVYCATAVRFSLARCDWSLAREFEVYLDRIQSQ